AAAVDDDRACVIAALPNIDPNARPLRVLAHVRQRLLHDAHELQLDARATPQIFIHREVVADAALLFPESEEFLQRFIERTIAAGKRTKSDDRFANIDVRLTRGSRELFELLRRFIILAALEVRVGGWEFV